MWFDSIDSAEITFFFFERRNPFKRQLTERQTEWNFSFGSIRFLSRDVFHRWLLTTSSWHQYRNPPRSNQVPQQGNSKLCSKTKKKKKNERDLAGIQHIPVIQIHHFQFINRPRSIINKPGSESTLAGLAPQQNPMRAGKYSSKSLPLVKANGFREIGWLFPRLSASHRRLKG